MHPLRPKSKIPQEIPADVAKSKPPNKTNYDLTLSQPPINLSSYTSKHIPQFISPKAHDTSAVAKIISPEKEIEEKEGAKPLMEGPAINSSSYSLYTPQLESPAIQGPSATAKASPPEEKKIEQKEEGEIIFSTINVKQAARKIGAYIQYKPNENSYGFWDQKQEVHIEKKYNDGGLKAYLAHYYDSSRRDILVSHCESHKADGRVINGFINTNPKPILCFIAPHIPMNHDLEMGPSDAKYFTSNAPIEPGTTINIRQLKIGGVVLKNLQARININDGSGAGMIAVGSSALKHVAFARSREEFIFIQSDKNGIDASRQEMSLTDAVYDASRFYGAEVILTFKDGYWYSIVKN